MKSPLKLQLGKWTGDVGEFGNRSERLFKEKGGSLILVVLLTQLEDG